MGRPIRHRRVRIYGFIFLLFITVSMAVLTVWDDSVLVWLQANQQWMHDMYKQQPFAVAIYYVLIFALSVALFIPAGIVMLVMGGMIFPFAEGVVWASIGNLLGSLAAFLIARHFFYREVQENYGKHLRRVNQGFRRHGGLYLFLLRLAPGFPAPVVNLLMGITSIRTGTYSIATLLGRIPITAVYMYLGVELAGIKSFSELLSAEVLMTFLLIALMAVAGKYLLGRSDRAEDLTV